MENGHHFNFLSINLVKRHNTPQIDRLTTIKSLFLRETETIKVPNLFYIHNMCVQDATMN